MQGDSPKLTNCLTLSSQLWQRTRASNLLTPWENKKWPLFKCWASVKTMMEKNQSFKFADAMAKTSTTTIAKNWGGWGPVSLLLLPKTNNWIETKWIFRVKLWMSLLRVYHPKPFIKRASTMCITLLLKYFCARYSLEPTICVKTTPLLLLTINKLFYAC